ncbi:MAG: ArdC-like ssDNA-binding domain-containing protein, partial [Chloroflexota bacterium]|nr:ArdC-like ssDNA-binding domain-containing protein [Chloroflexota bacterium]
MLTEVITAEIRAGQLRATIDGAIERLVGELAEGHTEEYRKLLRFWSRFHRYSHGNVLLILAQRPDATQVAGYHTWRKVGRQVKRGAKAISIWCPVIRQIPDPETGLSVPLCVGFNPCPVFAAEDLVDIATNPLPTLWRPLPDDMDGLYRYLKRKVEEAGYRVEEKLLPPGRQGSTAPDGTIALARGLDSRNRIMVLLHELAHALEHLREERQEAPRDQRELEAESAAMVVCALLGIEHPPARDYILMYRGDAEGLKASLSAIRRIVGRMVELLGLALSANESAAPLAAD